VAALGPSPRPCVQGGALSRGERESVNGLRVGGKQHLREVAGECVGPEGVVAVWVNV